MTLQLITHPDPRLDVACSPVTDFGPTLAKLADDMLELMYVSEGVGLAAPQVGAHVRLLVADPTGEGDPSGTYVMANPCVTWRSEAVSVLEEGCLSVPGARVRVKRSDEVDVEWSDVRGAKRRKRFNGLEARVIQHELDHLDGVLITGKREGAARGRAV